MARIIGSIATSHTPTIGFAHDWKTKDDPVWGPIFAAYEPIKAWISEKKPDVFFVIYNDHITSFFFDHYSAFALGIGERYAVADEGGGARDLPAIAGHAGLAQHIGSSLMADEFDMSFFQSRPLDHGCFSPLSMLVDHTSGWPVPLVPLQVGVLQFPIPSALRCFKLGQALRRAIESYPEDLKVVILATGGLSHQVHGERAGFNNIEWDAEFLSMIETNPQALTQLTHAQYATLGGMEGAEVIMWLIMRGAMNDRIRKLHQTLYLPSMTSIATAIYENVDVELPSAEEIEARRSHITHQLAGAEKLAGTYPYTLQRSVKAHRINRFLHDLVYKPSRDAFLADEEAEFEKAGLTAEERDLIRRRDWRGLIHYGAIFFVLEKLGAVVGVSNLHIYAAMRGEPLEDFQKTRNAPGALYSVAGQGAGKQAWDQPARK
jgi:gallate dioxygenase